MLFRSGGRAVFLPDGSTAYKKNGGGKADAEAIAAVRKNAQELQALIIKSAQEVKQYADSKTEAYNSLYVARSQFGDLLENYSNVIETMANGVVESYHYESAISSLNNVVQNYFTTIDGQIRRGFIEDPDNQGDYILGIAISQNLQFDAEVDSRSDGTYTYYHLQSGQTFGLYTSTGWQFWINGDKVGWFNSTDGMLHVRKVVAEEILQISGKWQLKAGKYYKELEFVYIGD